MVVDEVRKAVGPMFPIEARISGDDFTDKGLGLEACIKVAKMIDDKVDLINVSCGNHEDPDMFCRTHPSAFYPRDVNVYLAAEIKKHVKTPIACVGSLNDPAQMEEIIASGQADAVELGRASLADPYLPNKALCGQAEDITPCLRCYECFGTTGELEMVKCAVNPTMGEQLAAKCPKAAPEYIKAAAPDALIVAIGSEELCPPIPGLDSENVVMAVDAKLHPEKLGKRVAILGGGLVGAKGAIGFEHEGHECTIIELKPEIAPDVNSFYRGGLMPEVSRSAKCLVNTRILDITIAGELKYCKGNVNEAMTHGQSRSIYSPVYPIYAYMTLFMHKNVVPIQNMGTVYRNCK